MMNIEVEQMILKGYRMPKPSTHPEIPDSFYELMLQCWNMDPDQRPTMHYIRV